MHLCICLDLCICLNLCFPYISSHGQLSWSQYRSRYQRPTSSVQLLRVFAIVGISSYLRDVIWSYPSLHPDTILIPSWHHTHPHPTLQLRDTVGIMYNPLLQLTCLIQTFRCVDAHACTWRSGHWTAYKLLQSILGRLQGCASLATRQGAFLTQSQERSLCLSCTSFQS